MNVSESSKKTVILGAGLTGLTAAYVLNRAKIPVSVLEAEPFLGGASRTVNFNGYRFDLGGHRFYTKDAGVIRLVRGLLEDELLEVPRISRISLSGAFVDYPLSFFSALSALGPLTSCAVAASYAAEKVRGLFSERPQNSFEDWIVSRFGRRLYEIYFKPYSEKVWGVPCAELGADFAAQRIKGMSFRAAVGSMLLPKKTAPATLASRFIYPRLGFGRIPEQMADSLSAGSLTLNSRVFRIEHDGNRVAGVVSSNGKSEHRVEAQDLINTIPISDFVRFLSPAVPKEVLEAASGLRYRDLIVTFLTLDREQVTRDHWIYFPTESVFFGRIHQPKNWSAAMCPRGKTSLVVETFCFDNEPIWSEPDDPLIKRVSRRLGELKLISEREVMAGCVVRLRKAYPLYVNGYRQRMKTVMNFLANFKNVQCAGRNGLFRYTSGDWYIDMGMKAAENILGARHNLALVGSAQEYAES